MRILLVSDFFPTPDNYNGPSAIIYHIAKAWKKKHEVFIYTTNANKVPRRIVNNVNYDFDGKLYVNQRNLMQKILTSSKTGCIFNLFYPKNMFYISRYRLPRKVLNWIKAISPDFILVYPDHMTEVVRQLNQYKVIVLGPDCNTLYWTRALLDEYIYRENFVNKAIINLKKQIELSRTLSQLPVKIGVVGKEDYKLFETITNSRKAYFIPHPHYKLVEKVNKFSPDNIKIIISGNYDSYTYTDINKLCQTLISKHLLFQELQFTFIGRTWNPIIKVLTPYLNVNIIEWVEDYVSEIVKYDIQIFPISLGCGTKGKVLDALSSGIFCIGSHYAFENIAVKHEESCLIYNDITEITEYLLLFKKNPKKYIEMANKGKNNIRKYHNPSYVSNIIEQIAYNDEYNVNNEIYL